MRKITCFLLALFLVLSAMAHDFEAVNNGTTIYYTVTSNTAPRTVEVSFRGTTYNEYMDEYSGDVKIPNSVTYNGNTYSVTAIGAYAFYNCSSLTSISIANTVVSIKEGSIYGCSSLKSVSIPESVTSIGNHAFAYSTLLSSITISNSVNSIGEGAFRNCTSLTSITIPNLVTNIAPRFFYECFSLISINVNNDNPNYSSENGVLFDKNKTTLVCFPAGKTSAYIIPNSVKFIGDHAFYGCRLLSAVTIPNSVIRIESNTFAYCSSLTSINIPSTIVAIEANAFGFCTALKDIIVNWTTPLTIFSNRFMGVTTSNVRLIIPDGTYGLYAVAEVWKDFILTEFSGINTTNDVPLVIYPNPVANELKIETDSKINGIQITDLTGKMVYSSFVINNNLINVSTLPSGIYLVKIDTDKGVKTERVIVN